MNTKLKWGSTILIIAILVATVLILRTPKTEISQDILVPQPETNVPIEEAKTTTVSIYFPNSIKDPGFMDCRVVHAVTRTIPYTEGVATAAITELIKGLTADEIKNGYVTQIDPNVRIQSLSIKDGVASIDMSKELGSKNLGLCAGQFIKAQIEQTLLQFPTVKRVIVLINGDKEFVQP
ncbi:GerMN domain-containing protein [Patescibacteria group bacterium]|nr:GerMN domain-containing protein [Patescibacteria group bacterium]